VLAPDLLDGRIVLVSGGGSGLGRAIAQEMTAAGALVVFMTKYPRSVAEEAASTVPLQRLGRPDELAWIAAYLASVAGNYFLGSVLTLDGARDVWRGSFPTRDYVDASGSIVAEARPNGRCGKRART
jgi:NAD(P)-dependent dehydrogenase (short-subunit alcohol dehydrogenase family)